MGATSNAFSILKAVTDSSNGLPFAAIVTKTDLPKASVHRLLKELLTLHAVDFDPTTKIYTGGMLLARLGSTVTVNFDLRTAARQHLHDLQLKTGYVATLGMTNGNEGVYVDKIEPVGFGIKLHSEVGRNFPLHCTAMGKVMLAFGDPALRHNVLQGPLARFTKNTITDPEKLQQELAAITHDRYAVDREEITMGLTCIAAPIFGLNKIIGAMSCTFPSSLEDEKGREAIARLVQRQANLVTGTE